ncbi:acyltransferase [Halovibrio sp. HP20-50]|uniref:acyltransferase family protein n=1 Tax=Halovibrio sp. HP20-59 TaxID=3080275 RepID=UPI00294AE16B|nr:acyltransferase [Halovibrio sp. HP20-59]MEA2120096.1 acyltransferase [Halovibrio sp. HP20-59]
MGFLRFFLAVMVLLSHMGISLASINPGVSAVVVFYLLAGHVVCRLWQRQATLPLTAKLSWFYTDRLWRIVPLYLYALVVGALAWALGAQSYFISRVPDGWDWLQNLLVVPLNYYMLSGIDQFTLLPPAWSLAAELQFYLLVPFLLLNRYALAAALALSVVVFLLAQFGVLNMDIFGYRLLPGVLFIFLLGGLWQVSSAPRWPLGGKQAVLDVGWALAVGYTVWLITTPGARASYNLEVALGLALGVPLLMGLARLRFSPGLHRLQRWLGALSYGVFLLHFPVMWLLSVLAPALAENAWAVVAGSTVLAALGHVAVERPLWRRYRRMLA